MMPLIDLENECHGITGGACAHIGWSRFRAHRAPKRRHSRSRCRDHEKVPSAVSMSLVELEITLAHSRAPRSHVRRWICGRTRALPNRSLDFPERFDFLITVAAKKMENQELDD